jgi:hypothetical protein
MTNAPYRILSAVLWIFCASGLVSWAALMGDALGLWSIAQIARLL